MQKLNIGLIQDLLLNVKRYIFNATYISRRAGSTLHCDVNTMQHQKGVIIVLRPIWT